MFKKWLNKPDEYREEEGKLIIQAEANTDFFVAPTLNGFSDNAHLYMLEIGKEFTFSCKVKPFFKDTYDAGAIMFYIDSFNWVKFAFENTDMGYPAVVSVLTREYSDDCNGEEISADSIYLKLSRKDALIGLYYSLDGKKWKMKRLFHFANNQYKKTYLGIEAQSPQGNGCKVEFSEITFSNEVVEDFRKGI